MEASQLSKSTLHYHAVGLEMEMEAAVGHKMWIDLTAAGDLDLNSRRPPFIVPLSTSNGVSAPFLHCYVGLEMRKGARVACKSQFNLQGVA